MNCFPCFQCQKSKKALIDGEDKHTSDEFKESKADAKRQKGTYDNKKEEGDNNAANNDRINAQAFTFRELATATKNFRQECLLGEGGFGRVYKGTLRATGKVVAVKQLDRNGMQHGNKEFLDEVCSLSHMEHENLVNLVGYCADGDQRLLVYEFMSGGSVEDHVLDMKEDQKPLDWMTRMKIAYGAAQGLEYLHDKVNPPVVYRDLKSSNILLDNDLNPKLSDFGLAKLNPTGDKMHISPRVMGTYGYSAPEYARTGQCTIKSDVYSFGVVMLELITGRRAIDTTRSVEEQNLVAWAQPIFRDPKRFPDMADPLLRKKFPERGLNQAVAISAMCLQEEPGARPLMSDVVTALSFLSLPTEKIPDSPIESSEDGLSTEEGENENGEVTDENEMYSSGSDYDDAEEHEDEKLDYQEGDEEECQQSARQSQKWYSDATNNVSRKRSLDHKSASSSVDESNKMSQNEKETENISSINHDNSEGSINNNTNNNNNNENDNGNVISREKSSSKGSGDLGMKSLFTSLSRKSSKGGSKKEEKSASIKKKNRKRSSSLVAHKRSRKTQQQEGVTISSNHSRSMNSLNVVADDVKNIKEKSTAEPSSKNVTQEESSKSSEVVDSLHQNN